MGGYALQVETEEFIVSALLRASVLGIFEAERVSGRRRGPDQKSEGNEEKDYYSRGGHYQFARFQTIAPPWRPLSIQSALVLIGLKDSVSRR